MIYLDSSAIVKLVRVEAESDSLRAWVEEHHAATLVSSCLAEVEVVRALRRYEAPAVAGVPAVMAHMLRLDVDARIREMAASYNMVGLRTLDAIHLATAEVLHADRYGLESFVAYDAHLRAAAAARGLTTVCPGLGDSGPEP